MPRLNCTFAQVIAILEAHGFVLIRHEKSSHRRYRGVVGADVRYVDLGFHRVKDTVKPGTLKSIIRQSGLPQKLFRR